MTNKTRLCIKKYQEMLPGLKEKATAACFMMLIAMCTAVTATYAWVTISRAPEVSAIATTMAANGNLEIALAKEDGSQPDETDIDEGAPADTNDVATSNLQWGNLINLSDPSYGLSDLQLRPAQLNRASLLTNPLWGAAYGQDGRVTNLNSNYTYVKWDGFSLSAAKANEYGVRAIASYKTETSDTSVAEKSALEQAVTDATTVVNNKYAEVCSKFAGLGDMINRFAQDKVNASSYAYDENDKDSDMGKYLPDVISLYEAMDNAMNAQHDAYTALANLQYYQWVKAQDDMEYVPMTWQDIVDHEKEYNSPDVNTKSTNGTISITGLSTFIQDQKTLQNDMQKMREYYTKHEEDGTIYRWSTGGESGYQINQMISRLVDYSNMYIQLEEDKKVLLVNLQSLGTGLLQYNNKTKPIYISSKNIDSGKSTSSIFLRFEQNVLSADNRLKGRGSCDVNLRVMSVGYKFKLKGQVHTEATGVSAFEQNFADACSQQLDAKDIIAEDTYGMAVDFWLRTNAEQTCLTLEGATVVDDTTNSVVSYNGVNRIWGSSSEDKSVLTSNSTTQGGGSCYVYYADNPADMNRSLKLLEAMKVAFVDSSGSLLAIADMDTDNYYAQNGRITVPLALDSSTKTTYQYADSTGKTQTGRAITTLYTDVPVRITAIVYLDGTVLTNEDVLSAGEIEGQLNLQFGSSQALDTVGDKNLMDDERTVSAEVENDSMDFDAAVSEDDLTTMVTLHVQGTDPKAISAFFVRAINSTQGTRENDMNFTRQADGTWTASHAFTAPGEYYLRYVRLDGVDYALAEPVKVTVSGFGLTNVTWGESTDTATIQTSNETYSENLKVEFSSNDQTKLPKAVQAQFVRDDGNMTTVALTQGASGIWTGTANFSTSGVYTLSYLIYDDGDVYDLKNFSKTLNLSLGLQVKIKNLEGALDEKYVAGTTYARKVSVEFLDNAGNALTEREGMVLYYSNGASISGAVPAPLTWNHTDRCYTGTLPITKAGTYRFLYMSMGDGKGNITKATESPTYTIRNPEPPKYEEESQTSYNTETQFVPFTNDAVIDQIKIANSESATVTAVVYNDYWRKCYPVEARYVNNSWTINLPTYTLNVDDEGKPLENAQYTQEGTWQVLWFRLTNCYDASGVLHDESNPIILADSGDLADTNLRAEKLTADEKHDFSKLTTKVSCGVQIQMYEGSTTTLGSAATPFMTRFAVNDLGMYVTVTDNNGNAIPADKINDIILNVQYNAPTDSSYGYKVQSGTSNTYAIKLKTQDPDSGRWSVSSTDVWQLVGQYTVKDLQVSIGKNNTVVTKKAGDSGVPTQYTIRTQTYSSSNIALLDQNVSQRDTVFGKTGNNITGKFLDSWNPGVTAKVTLQTDDGSDTSKVVLEGVEAKVKLTYQNGKTAPNGGYSWTAANLYENIELTMTGSDNRFTTGTTPLLAGEYAAELDVTINGQTQTKTLKNISVYSMAPSVTVSAISPDSSEKFSFNADAKAESWTEAEAGDSITEVQNYVSKDKLSATVYLKAKQNKQIFAEGTSSEFSRIGIRYDVPTVTLKLSNAGTAMKEATLVVANNAKADYAATYTFSADNSTNQQSIGQKEEKSKELQSSSSIFGGSSKQIYYWDTPFSAGSQTIENITITDKVNQTAYTVNLQNPLTIRQPETAPPSISYQTAEGYDAAFEMQTSPDGEAFTVTLPTADAFGTQQTEKPVYSGNTDWGDPVSTTSNKYCYAVRGEKQSYDETTSGGCTSTTNTYYFYEFTYHQFERVQRTYEKTSKTTFYNVKEGLTGWQIGDTVYRPGELVTISGVVVAKPIIGELSRVYLREETVTMVHTTEQDVAASPATSTSNNKDKKLKSADEAMNGQVLPSGYSWFNASDAYDDSQVNTTEHQVGVDHKKS